MLNCSSFAWLGVLAVLACSGEDSDTYWEDDSEVWDSDYQGAAEPEQIGTASREFHGRQWIRAWAVEPGATGQTRLTADGERIEVIVPAPAPTQVVPVGGTCGIQNADGVLLSCQPGTFCLSPADGVAGTCQPGLTAPRTDG